MPRSYEAGINAGPRRDDPVNFTTDQLSPGINDPGTAIRVMGSLIRVLLLWSLPKQDDKHPAKFDRVAIPELSIRDMFDDAFSAIARDGAGTLEVVIRLQKALESLALTDCLAMREAAKEQARISAARAENALTLDEDVAAVKAAVRFAKSAN